MHHVAHHGHPPQAKPAQLAACHCPGSSTRDTALLCPSPVDHTSCRPLLPQSLVRAKGAWQMLDVSRSTFYQIVKNDPTFPKSFRLGNAIGSLVVWRTLEILAWVDARAALSRAH